MGTVNNYGNVLLPANSNTIDVQTLLSAAIQSAQIPLTLLEEQQANVQSQITALNSFVTDVNSLQTAASALSSPTGAINSLTASSSDSDLVTASADTTATAGTHTVVVNSLATTSSYYTDPVATSTTAIGEGSFQVQVGSGAAATVTVDDTNDNLNELAASINSQNIGVTATVVTDANGARLALVSGTTGSAGNITISGNTTSLNFNQAAQGNNASLTVDGVPISSTSNTISTVIPGVTLNLNGADANTTVTVGIASDTDAATSAVSAFVSAWNTVIGDLNSEFDVTSTGSGGVTGGGALESDNTLRDVQNQLLAAVTDSIGGNNGFVNLSSIGVTLNQDGTLSLDSGTLTNALNTNFSSVQNLLQGTSGIGTFLSNTLTDLTDPSTGVLTIDQQGYNQTNQDLTNQINDMQSQLTVQTQNLTTQYAQLQSTLDEMPMLQSQIQGQLASLTSS
jgi:flagellar hook-associated protein 2